MSKTFWRRVRVLLSPDAKAERNICPHCHTVHAVRDVSMNLYPGEIVGIVGESGSANQPSCSACISISKQRKAKFVQFLFDGGVQNLLTLFVAA